MASGIRARIPEIRQAILDRLYAMEEEAPTLDAEYQRGLCEAAAGGVEYGIALLEHGLERGPEVPIALIAQPRLAARQGIPLETVMRRYLAAKTVLSDCVLQEAAAVDLRSPALLRRALIDYDTAFDRLLSAVADEYKREGEHGRSSHESQLAEAVRRLLAGEPVDSHRLNYDLSAHHLGIVVGSAEARQTIRLLAAETDSRPLIVRATEDETWGWLGRRKHLDPATVAGLAARVCSPSAPIAIGEPEKGLSGWRLTHRQARGAFSVAKVSPTAFARYAEVVMVIGAVENPTMGTSLQKMYLAPLKTGRNGDALRDTLRAYFAANRNGKSAASALGVSRQTVANRLEQVEARIGQPLSMCADALNAALRMEELALFVPDLDIV